MVIVAILPPFGVIKSSILYSALCGYRLYFDSAFHLSSRCSRTSSAVCCTSSNGTRLDTWGSTGLLNATDGSKSRLRLWLCQPAGQARPSRIWADWWQPSQSSSFQATHSIWRWYSGTRKLWTWREDCPEQCAGARFVTFRPFASLK